MDAVFDSVSIATTFKEELAEYGVIFSSISEAINDYSKLIEKYLGTIVPIGDNYFSALNSAVFTDGSFCRSEEHTSELHSHSFISYAVFRLKKKTTTIQ